MFIKRIKIYSILFCLAFSSLPFAVAKEEVKPLHEEDESTFSSMSAFRRKVLDPAKKHVFVDHPKKYLAAAVLLVLFLGTSTSSGPAAHIEGDPTHPQSPPQKHIPSELSTLRTPARGVVQRPVTPVIPPTPSKLQPPQPKGTQERLTPTLQKQPSTEEVVALKQLKQQQDAHMELLKQQQMAQQKAATAEAEKYAQEMNLKLFPQKVYEGLSPADLLEELTIEKYEELEKGFHTSGLPRWICKLYMHSAVREKPDFKKLTAADIPVIDPKASRSPAEIFEIFLHTKELSPEQLAGFSPGQLKHCWAIPHLTEKQIRGLPSEKFDALFSSSEKLNLLTKEQIAAMTDAQRIALNKRVNELSGPGLSKEFLEAFFPNYDVTKVDFSVLDQDPLGALKFELCQKNMGKLSADQINAFSGEQINLLDRDFFSQISDKTLKDLSPDFLAKLLIQAIGGMKEEHFNLLSDEQQTAVIPKLGYERYSVENSDSQVRTILNPKRIAQLKEEQLKAIEWDRFLDLSRSSKHLAAFNKKAFDVVVTKKRIPTLAFEKYSSEGTDSAVRRVLSPERIATLEKEQLEAIEWDQFLDLSRSSKHLAAFEKEAFDVVVTKKRIPTLAFEKYSSEDTDSAVRRVLSPERIATLEKEQLEAIEWDQFLDLSRSSKHLAAFEKKAFDVVVTKKRIPTLAFEKYSSEDTDSAVRRVLSPERIATLEKEQLEAITPDQIKDLKNNKTRKQALEARKADLTIGQVKALEAK